MAAKPKLLIKVPPKPIFRRIIGLSKAKREHLKKQPECQICGTKEGVAVHHIVPIWIRPDLAGLESNMITLCENNKKNRRHDHFVFGHLCESWRHYDEDITGTARRYRRMFERVEDNISQPNPQLRS